MTDRAARGRRWRPAIAIVGLAVGFAPLLGAPPAAALAQAEPDQAQSSSADTVAPDPSAPNLVCSGRRLPALSLERSGTTSGYSCRVVGAAPGETGFTLRATPLETDGSAGEPLDPFCSGDLDGGTGVCSRVVVAEGSSGTPVLSVSGTLLPSGRALDPTTVVAGLVPRPLPPEMLPPAQT